MAFEFTGCRLDKDKNSDGGSPVAEEAEDVVLDLSKKSSSEEFSKDTNDTESQQSPPSESNIRTNYENKLLASDCIIEGVDILELNYTDIFQLSSNLEQMEWEKIKSELMEDLVKQENQEVTKDEQLGTINSGRVHRDDNNTTGSDDDAHVTLTLVPQTHSLPQQILQPRNRTALAKNSQNEQVTSSTGTPRVMPVRSSPRNAQKLLKSTDESPESGLTKQKIVELIQHGNQTKMANQVLGSSSATALQQPGEDCTPMHQLRKRPIILFTAKPKIEPPEVDDEKPDVTELEKHLKKTQKRVRGNGKATAAKTTRKTKTSPYSYEAPKTLAKKRQEAKKTVSPRQLPTSQMDLSGAAPVCQPAAESSMAQATAKLRALLKKQYHAEYYAKQKAAMMKVPTFLSTPPPSPNYANNYPAQHWNVQQQQALLSPAYRQPEANYNFDKRNWYTPPSDYQSNPLIANSQCLSKPYANAWSNSSQHSLPSSSDNTQYHNSQYSPVGYSDTAQQSQQGFGCYPMNNPLPYSNQLPYHSFNANCMPSPSNNYGYSYGSYGYPAVGSSMSPYPQFQYQTYPSQVQNFPQKNPFVMRQDFNHDPLLVRPNSVYPNNVSPLSLENDLCPSWSNSIKSEESSSPQDGSLPSISTIRSPLVHYSEHILPHSYNAEAIESPRNDEYKSEVSLPLGYVDDKKNSNLYETNCNSCVATDHSNQNETKTCSYADASWYIDRPAPAEDQSNPSDSELQNKSIFYFG